MKQPFTIWSNLSIHRFWIQNLHKKFLPSPNSRYFINKSKHDDSLEGLKTTKKIW